MTRMGRTQIYGLFGTSSQVALILSLTCKTTSNIMTQESVRLIALTNYDPNATKPLWAGLCDQMWATSASMDIHENPVDSCLCEDKGKVQLTVISKTIVRKA